jgi:hypothetical protein
MGTRVDGVADGGGASPTLAEGDLIIRGASADERLAIGGAGKVLTSNGTTATWEVGSPITAQGDLIIGDALGAPIRLAKGADGKVLKAGATTVSWDDPPAPSVDLAALMRAQRRLAADAYTLLLYECDGASGDLVNTGTLGSAGNLTPGGTCARNVLSPASPIGRGILCNVASTTGAVGATGITVTGTALTVSVTVYVASWWNGDVPLIARNAGPTWASPYLGFRTSFNTGGAIQTELHLASGHVSTYQFGHAAGFYQIVTTYDGSTLRLYINGSLASSASNASTLNMGVNGAGGMWGLGMQGNGVGFNGLILRAQVLNTTWSADRVAEEWLRTVGQNPTSSTRASCSYWWPLSRPRCLMTDRPTA